MWVPRSCVLCKGGYDGCFYLGFCMGGWPALTGSLREPFPPRVPHPCVLCKGGRPCCLCYVILLRTRDRAHLVPAFATPALRQGREGRGTPLCWRCKRDQKHGPPALGKGTSSTRAART